MKKLAIVAVALVLAVSGLGGCKKKESGKSDLPPPTGEGAKPMPEIPDVSKPEQPPGTAGGSGAGTGTAPIENAAITGTLEAREQIAVGPKASGTIVALTVDENSKVKKGDLLFRLDSGNAQLSRKSAMTQLSGAKLQLRTAQKEYDRISGLVAQNALPAAQLDPLEAQVEGAKVAISAAQNSIAMANKQIADATTRSPMSGVVIKKMLSVGEYATMMPPSPVVMIQDQSTLELKFNVPERSIQSLHQGDPVMVTIASMGVTRAAKISQISPMVDPKTRTIQLTAILDNCDGGLRPGLAAEVTMGASADVVAVAPECGKVAAKAPTAAAKSAPAPKKKPTPMPKGKQP